MSAIARRIGAAGAYGRKAWTPLCLFGVGCFVIANHASAQTTLPGIVVTTPSPVVRAPQPPTQATPALIPAAAPAGASSPAPSPVANFDLTPPPGSIIVVDDAFVPVTVTTAREVDAKQGQTITDTLMQKPGISGSSFAAGANRPIIRGLDNARVRVQENGIGSHDVSTLSEDHAVPIDPNAVERIEVVRGPATLRYGSQAIGGVVAVENNESRVSCRRAGSSPRRRAATHPSTVVATARST